MPGKVEKFNRIFFLVNTLLFGDWESFEKLGNLTEFFFLVNTLLFRVLKSWEI
jgi:hypothetical protein